MIKNACSITILSFLLTGCVTTPTPSVNESSSTPNPKTAIVEETPVPYVVYSEDYYPRYYHHYYNGPFFHGDYRRF